ncbi:hypothetical protein EXIGLDRAFT_783268 [Exidia glandulosa HHB12029]|uniref:Uncharacterized protein n=1 Tax=Exidia glandulosa HHB12029 TaxID=1314781 RepID=A0A165Z2F3_EXIGL|nr:hypothetical protein EXIGLDRAFT_783268 [Exidia glandulosa HHB12029]
MDASTSSQTVRREQVGMIKEECMRRLMDNLKGQERINYDGQHEPRHDAESAWWTFLWAFPRSSTQGAPSSKEMIGK